MKTRLTLSIVITLCCWQWTIAQWGLANDSNNQDLQGVQVLSENDIVAGGAYGILLKTENFGQSWQDVSTPSFDGYVSSLIFLDENVGYVHGWGKIAKTTNGGLSWQNIYTAPSWHYFSMGFYDEDHITITGRTQVSDKNYWSTNSGPSGWHGGVLLGPNSNPQYHDCQYLSKDTVYALTFGGMSRSYDGGETWEYIDNDNQISANAGWNVFHFLNSQVGYIGASNYTDDSGIVYKTTDGGNSYKALGPLAKPIRSIHFINETIGFAGCEEGFIYKTNDGGETWYGDQLGSTTIQAIDFYNENVGAFVNESGHLFTTTNGGNQIPATVDLSLERLNMPYVINLESGNQRLEVQLRNVGLNLINRTQLHYQIDSDPVQTMTINNMFLNNFESSAFTHSIPWEPTLGVHDIKIWISDPNDQDDQVVENDTIRFYTTVVEKALNNRNVLGEDATGAWCGYCPPISLAFDTLAKWYNTDDRKRFIGVGQHSGDILEVEGSQIFANTWNSGGFPSFWFDRFRYFGSNQVKIDGDMLPAFEERLATDAPLDISAVGEFDESNRQIDLEIKTNFIGRVDGDLVLNVWILEDGLPTNQVNFYNTVSGSPLEGLGDPIVGFLNNHVFRENITPIWGDDTRYNNANSPGDEYTFNYSFELSDNYDEEATEIVIFVSKNGAEITDREILNAQAIPVSKLSTDISSVDGFNDFNVSPNPFGDWLDIDISTSSSENVVLSIYSISGLLMHQEEFSVVAGNNKLNWDLQNIQLTSGMYVLRCEGTNIFKEVKIFKGI